MKRLVTTGVVIAACFASTGGSLATGFADVAVPANVRTTDSGVVIAPGTAAIITATGTWDVCNGECPGGPDGATNGALGACPGVEGRPAGELIGSLDGGLTFFPLGSGPTVVTGSGVLLLGPNDCGSYDDNSGELVATAETFLYPTTKAACEDDGWRDVRRLDGTPFSNQGDCVSYVNSLTGTTKLDIPANARTTASAVDALPGMTATVRATGTWDVCNGECPGGPDGATNGALGACPGVEGRPAGELIGSLDGGLTFFPLGSGPTVVTGSGVLLLGPNDCGSYDDNVGALRVKIALHEER